LFLDFPAYLFDFTGSGIAKLNSDSLGDAESVLRWPASSGTSPDFYHQGTWRNGACPKRVLSKKRTARRLGFGDLIGAFSPALPIG
jgi:hypothetical protein